MDWEKAKNIVIVLFLILNLALAGLYQAQKKKYDITPQELTAITNIMEDYGVTLAGELPRTAAPMRELSVGIPSLDSSRLIKQFFGENADVKITVAFNQTILQEERARLTIEGNHVLYENPEGTGQIADFSMEKAEEVALSYINNLNNAVSNVQLGYAVQEGQHITLVYYELYKGYSLYDSRRQVVVTPKGVVSYEAMVYEAQGFTGDKQSVYGADEALLAFCIEMAAQGAQGLTITKMELGYAVQQVQDIEQGTTVKMVPCYAIYTEGTGVPMLVNALTNSVQQPWSYTRSGS